MWVLKPAGLIILLMIGYMFFKPGKITEIARNFGRSRAAFKEGMSEEEKADKEDVPKD